MTLVQKIERCKQEIRYRADYMCLPYDDEDIEHFTLPDGTTIVALTKIISPVLVDTEDDTTEGYARGKTPMIYAVTPTREELEVRYRVWAYDVRAYAHLPRVHVRFPQLVYIIWPGGTIKSSESPEILEGIVRRKYRQRIKVTQDLIKEVMKKAIDLESPD